MGQQTLIWKQNIHLTGATPNNFFFIFSESSVDSWNLLCYLWSWIYITLDYNVILFIGKYVHFDKAKVSFLKILIWQKCTFDKANVYFLIRQKCHRQTRFDPQRNFCVCYQYLLFNSRRHPFYNFLTLFCVSFHYI